MVGSHATSSAPGAPIASSWVMMRSPAATPITRPPPQPLPGAGSQGSMSVSVRVQSSAPLSKMRATTPGPLSSSFWMTPPTITVPENGAVQVHQTE